MYPKISVITAVYNGDKYLRETIQSILSQSFNDFEYIIINDCSNDKSLEILNEFAKNDSRIFIKNNIKNIGSVESRNIGLKLAKGKYVAILDHDDISMQDRLRKQFTFLENHKNIFMVGGGAINVDENGIRISKFKPIIKINKIKKTLPFKNCFYHPTVMYRNEGLLFYRKNILYSDDYDFYLRLLSEKKILANMSDVLIKYRLHRSSSSSKNFTRMELFAEKTREFYRQREIKGFDNYEDFDPKEIINIDLKESLDRFILRNEISASFHSKNYNNVIFLAKKYFLNYGYLDKTLIYFCVSLFRR